MCCEPRRLRWRPDGMPTYDYRCKACDHAFELAQSMKAPVKRKCPSCGKLQLERLIGVGAGFIIKGGAASAKAEAAEKKADEAARKKAADGGDKGNTAEKSSGSAAASKANSSVTESPAGGSSSSGDAAEKKPEKKAPADPPERKVSGSTSTPTHAAREGRGVGNLVDKAKRRSREATRKTPTRSKRSDQS